MWIYFHYLSSHSQCPRSHKFFRSRSTYPALIPHKHIMQLFIAKINAVVWNLSLVKLTQILSLLSSLPLLQEKKQNKLSCLLLFRVWHLFKGSFIISARILVTSINIDINTLNSTCVVDISSITSSLWHHGTLAALKVLTALAYFESVNSWYICELIPEKNGNPKEEEDQYFFVSLAVSICKILMIRQV